MHRSRWRSVSVVVLRVVITLLYIPAILPKLRNPSNWAHLFTTWGYPPWAAVVISIVEIIGLIVLWIPGLAKSASACLMIILAGAIGTWLIHGPRPVAAYPGTILVLIALLLWLQVTTKRQTGHQA